MMKLGEFVVQLCMRDQEKDVETGNMKSTIVKLSHFN